MSRRSQVNRSARGRPSQQMRLSNEPHPQVRFAELIALRNPPTKFTAPSKSWTVGCPTKES